MVDFLQYLGEFDRRDLYLPLGYDSLFEYCTGALHLSKAAAFRRITAARLMRRFPEVAGMLRDGRLGLTTVTLLKDVLTEDNHCDLLARAAGMTKDQVEALVAIMRPRPAPRDGVQPLPPARIIALPATAVLASAVETALSTATAAPANPAQVLVAVQPAPPTRIEAISEELRVLRITVSQQFLDELDQVKAAVSHKVPSGRLEDVLRECFRVVLERQRKKTAGPKPAVGSAAELKDDGQPQDRGTPAIGSAGEPAPDAKTKTPAGPDRDAMTWRPLREYIPVELFRQVWRRDGGRCVFRGPDGHVCGSRHQLELDHIHPLGCGGATTLDNLVLHCRCHNQWRARQTYGERTMARFRRSDQRIVHEAAAHDVDAQRVRGADAVARFGDGKVLAGRAGCASPKTATALARSRRRAPSASTARGSRETNSPFDYRHT